MYGLDARKDPSLLRLSAAPTLTWIPPGRSLWRSLRYSDRKGAPNEAIEAARKKLHLTMHILVLPNIRHHLAGVSPFSPVYNAQFPGASTQNNPGGIKSLFSAITYEVVLRIGDSPCTAEVYRKSVCFSSSWRPAIEAFVDQFKRTMSMEGRLCLADVANPGVINAALASFTSAAPSLPVQQPPAPAHSPPNPALIQRMSNFVAVGGGVPNIASGMGPSSGAVPGFGQPQPPPFKANRPAAPPAGAPGYYGVMNQISMGVANGPGVTNSMGTSSPMGTSNPLGAAKRGRPSNSPSVMSGSLPGPVYGPGSHVTGGQGTPGGYPNAYAIAYNAINGGDQYAPNLGGTQEIVFKNQGPNAFVGVTKKPRSATRGTSSNPKRKHQ